jgi:hypothetical protein
LLTSVGQTRIPTGLTVVEQGLYPALEVGHSRRQIRHSGRYGPAGACGDAQSATFADAVIPDELPIRLQQGAHEARSDTLAAQIALAGINADGQSFEPHNALLGCPRHIAHGIHDDAATGAAETYRKKPAPILHAPKQIIRPEPAHKRDEAAVYAASNVPQGLFNTYMTPNGRVNFTGPLPQQKTGKPYRVVAALVPIPTGATAYDHTVRRRSNDLFENNLGHYGTVGAFDPLVHGQVRDMKILPAQQGN